MATARKGRAAFKDIGRVQMNAAVKPIGKAEAFAAKPAAEIARGYVKSGIDWTTIGWTAIGLSAIALSTFAAWTDRIPLWAGFLVNGYFMFFIFATMHEASHGNIAHGRLAWLNGFLGWLCGFVNVISYRGWGDLHAVHHSQVNDPVLDPDGWMMGRNPLNVVFRCATIPPHYIHYYLSTKAYDRIRDGWFCFFSLFFPWILALGVSTLVWRATGDWRLFVLWPFAGYMCIFLTGVLFVWFPHYPKEGRGRTDNSTTYVFHGAAGALMRHIDLWQSYHLIHHAFPRVPFYRQGRLFAAVRDQVEADGSVIIEVGGR